MGVRQDHRLDGLRVTHERPVLAVAFVPLSLEGAAVDEVAGAVDIEYMLRAGHFARGSLRMECYSHS